MKRKILLLALFITLISCIFAITISADSLSDFINIDLTLTDGTQTVGYLKKGGSWDGYQGYDRVTLYADYTDTSKTIAWSNVKIFDGRRTEICTYDAKTGIFTKTGTYPQTLLAYSDDVSNMEKVYYPQGALYIADNSFASGKGYSSLEYVWIPNTVQIISYTAFYGLDTLTTVELEENSQLKEIRREAFRACSALTSFDFPEGFETVGWAAFYLSGLSGTVALPNSVIKLDDGAFRGTKIEVFKIGDGPVDLGYNIVGNDGDQYLREIYIPIEATFVNEPNNAWFKSSAGPISFYVIAKEGEDTSAFVSTLKSTGRVKFATQEEVNAGTAPSDYSAVIITGYNKCKAFYNDVHKENEDFICITNNLCLTCNKILTEGLANHQLLNTIKYPNGFGKDGICGSLCTNNTCTYVDGEETVAKAIFGASGYSIALSGAGLNGGFTFDLDAYTNYLNATQNALRFGIIAVNANSFEQGSALLNSEGKLNSNLGLQVEMTTTEYSKFSYSIDNFSENAKEKLELIFVLYIIDSDGNVSYVQSESDYANKTKVGGVIFDSVNLNLVAAQEAKTTAYGDATEPKK